MAQRASQFPGGYLACGEFGALLKPDPWTALQWMRFLYSRADSAADALLREQPIPPHRADELLEFVAKVHQQSGEPLFPLRFGRGAHLQNEVKAMVGRAPARRKAGGKPQLRDLATVEAALAALAGLARHAVEQNAPVLAASAMTLLRRAWDARWSEEGRADRAAYESRGDEEAMRSLESEHPEIDEAVWKTALRRCKDLERAAVEVAERNRSGGAGGALPVATLARRMAGFPDEVYREALSYGYFVTR